MSSVRHYRGDALCPECGGGYDPETGYCQHCEGDLELYRVEAFTREWLAHSEAPPANAPARTVSRRRVGETVESFLAYRPALIIVQNMPPGR